MKRHVSHRAQTVLCFGVIFWLMHVHATPLRAQLQDVSEYVPLLTEHFGGYLGEGLSFADFNGDFIDDLSFADSNGHLKFFVGTGDETGFEPIELPISEVNEEAKMVLWCDVDNDGDQDLFVTYRLSPNKMYLSNGAGQYQDVSAVCGIQQNDKKSYGASFGDFDQDGFNDLFVCHYSASSDAEPLNELYRNNGDGTFEDITMNSVDLSVPNLQCFQSQWVDFNEDGWLDIHVIRDRPIHPNYYFTQTEATPGIFHDSAPEMGLDVAINCMSTSVADFDRDMDLDVFLTAFPTDSNWLMINDGGIFDSTNDDGVSVQDELQIEGVSWAGNWLDVDCDGWEDLHVTTGFDVFTYYPSVLNMFPDEPDHLYYNYQGLFDGSVNELDSTSVLSFATVAGDYNLDGFPDLVSHRVGEYAQVLKGTPNSHNWIKLWLEGVDSNRDGVGSKIRIYTGDEVQYRMTFCGENYLGQNSRWEHFGLGNFEIVDSLTIEWLGGNITSFTNLPVNEHVVINESNGMQLLWSSNNTSGCIYPLACNYEESATEDDGSCDFSCLYGENICGPGSYWEESAGQCLPLETLCEADFNGDGSVAIADLLMLLVAYNTPCP